MVQHKQLQNTDGCRDPQSAKYCHHQSVSALRMLLASLAYLLDSERKIWLHKNYNGISYSDGDLEENHIKAIIDQAHDVSVLSAELAEYCIDWPTLYHLSRKRANVLRPFEDEFRDKEVLEIGAGCGAITRYLGESGAMVLALEGSPRRASIAASRCRGLENVTVVAEAFHQLSPMHQFDVVTLVGVLEYARQFFPVDNGDPIDAMLAHAKKFLRPGGKLIIAIENQLGLKYFAGFPEDHVGKPMYGIEEHYTQGSVATFGRRELGSRVAKAGLDAQQWWYPFPDYKLPSLIVSEIGAIPQDGADLTPVVRSACIRDPHYPTSVSINQERAWRPIVRNGLLGEMANSFILLASDIDFEKMTNLPLAVHYATDRRPEFVKKVVFEGNAGGEVITSQVALYPHATPLPDSPLKQKLEDQPFVKGELWQDRLVQIMTSPGWTVGHVEEWFRIWFDAFCNIAGIENLENITYQKVSGKYFDAIPSNMVIDGNGSAKFIDQEWFYSIKLDAGYILFRALLGSFASVGTVAKPEINTNIQVLSLITDVLKRFGCHEAINEFESYIDIERKIHKLAAGTFCKLNSEDFETWSLRVFDTLIERDGEIKRLEMRCAELEWSIKVLETSRSWKITAPLRFVTSATKELRQRLVTLLKE